MIHALEKSNNYALLQWAKEVSDKKYKTVNMLGCHEGIPVLDLKGKTLNGQYNKGLLEDEESDDLIQIILDRGGKIQNLFGADGKKISYYQVNATYYSALGENDKKLLLARAIQVFMPGIPQIWYLDLFKGKNDYKAVELAGDRGHKEINRTNLTINDVEKKLKDPTVLKQLEIIRFRNNCQAFNGDIHFHKCQTNEIDISWKNGNEAARLKGNLSTYDFTIEHSESQNLKRIIY